MANHSPKFLEIVADALTRVQEMTVQDVHQKLARGDDFSLIDVREESEWAAGHLPRAVHLSKGVIERDVEQQIPQSDREIVVYCGGGYRSALAAENLQRMGYGNVWSMAGGMRQWRAAGLPTEPGSVRSASH